MNNSNKKFNIAKRVGLLFVILAILAPAFLCFELNISADALSLYNRDEAIIFDLSQGKVSFTDTTYSGKDVNGNTISGEHKPENIYVIEQPIDSSATNNVISVGTPTQAVTTKFEIHLRNLTIEAPKESSNHAPAVYVNTAADTVYLILDNGTSSSMTAYAKIIQNKALITPESARFGHAAIEKEIGTQGTLVVTCEEGYVAHQNNPLMGHECLAADNCGILNATAKGNAGFVGGNTRTSAAAAIGSKAEISDASHSRGSLTNAPTMGTLYNLTIAGGKITATGATGNSNTVDGKKVYLGGSPGIGVGAGMQQFSVGYALTNLCITGGSIDAIAGDGSAANIGGGYHAGYVDIKIYGGTILATKQLTSADDMKRGAGIGGGGGGSDSNATAGATVSIYGGHVTSTSSYGAAIGSGGGGKNGQATSGEIMISGGTVIATTVKGNNNNGAGAAIGAGGSLGTGKGGKGTVTITGGTVIASSEGGADIGGGGTNSTSASSAGGDADVTISGGTVYAENGGIGGGRANKGAGGGTTVTISGGTVNASTIGGGTTRGSYHHGGNATVIVRGDAYIILTGGIGGGDCIKVESGDYAKAVGGNATVTVESGYLECGDIGGGNSYAGNGGAAEIIVSGGTLKAKSIGGGSTQNPEKSIGYATANISGGEITGQFIMAAGGTDACTFTMTGGRLFGVDATTGDYTKKDGGAIYMDDPEGVVDISGGIIEDCKAENGGAIYMTAGTATISGTASIQNCSATENGGAIYMGGGELEMSGGTLSSNKALNGAGAYLAAGEMTISGGTIIDSIAAENGGAAYLGGGKLTVSNGTITSNEAINGAGAYLSDGEMIISGGTIVDNAAAENGGAAYLGGGELTVSGGDITSNNAINGAGAYLASGTMQVLGGEIKSNVAAENGGAAYLAGGSFTMINGSISNNTAQNGAGAFVANGNVTVKGGKITQNKATENGGAFYISNGNYTMVGGELSHNQAITGDGGAIYISATQNNTDVTVRSGSIINNTAGNSGGALGVYGQNGVTFTITIGSHTHHPNDGRHMLSDGINEETCPIVKNNTSQTSGGGIYLAGSYEAIMNMHCLEEEGNKVGDGHTKSDFMMIDGGTLNINTQSQTGEGEVLEDYGNVVISSSIHVTKGVVTLTGTGDNPMFKESVTVDVDHDIGSFFYDHRKGGDARTVQYYENLNDSGQYVTFDALGSVDHIVYANMYTNPGYTMRGWRYMTVNAEGDYVPTDLVFQAGMRANKDTYSGDLIFFAVWEKC